MNHQIFKVKELMRRWASMALAAFLLFSCSGILAQGGGHCMVQLDKPFYVNGEVAWYKLYLPPQFEGRERVIQVSVLNQQGAIQDRHHLRTLGKTYVHGYYKVPYDCRTGMYQFVFSGVRRALGSNVLLAQTEVAIYNDFDVISPDQVAPSAAGRGVEAGVIDEDLRIEIDVAPSVTTRAMQDVRITVRDASGQPVAGHLSVSVVDDALVPPSPLVRGPDLSYGVVEEQLANNIFVKGVVRDKTGAPLQVNVLGAFSPAENRVQYAKSDQAGVFSMPLADFYGKKIIQFVGFQQEVDKLSAEVIREVPAQPATRQVAYTPEVLDYLALSRKRKKIFQYFTALEQNLEVAVYPTDRAALKPDFTYRIAEYEDFDYVKDFFGELITPLKFRMVDSTYFASVENPKGRTIQETHLSGNPLFIVDGKLTSNADFVARMDMSPIETIDLFYDPYKLRNYFNAIGRSGVVRITTKLPDAPFPEADLANIWEIDGMLPEAEFPSLTSDAFTNAEYPLMRTQLYWDATVTTNDRGVAQLTIPQSDDLTAFRIVVLAQAADGARGLASTTYTVQLR
ncbi:MAG: hypothetical protein R3301_12135 [Saprospiraceae bacterium]|nr:hypothetical protein [Saprospiraceae bacterium]